MIRPLRILKAIIEYPIGERSNPARELARIGHAKHRALIRATAQQMRFEMGLPPDNRLRG